MAAGGRVPLQGSVIDTIKLTVGEKVNSLIAS